MRSIGSAPPFVSRRHPRSPDNSLLLSAFIYEIGDNPDRERSRRTVQQDLVRSNGSGVSDREQLLIDEGWLRIPKWRAPGRGNRFAYGELLNSRPLRAEWRQMSERIWGQNGFLAGQMKDPLFAHGALGWSGALIYAVMIRYPAPFSVREAKTFFDGMFSPSKTAYRLGRLEEKNLIIEDPAGYRLNPNHAYEAEMIREDYRSRQEQIESRVSDERKRYRSAIGHSSVLDQLRDSYRGLTCIRCPSEARQIEHFPPLKWSGEDDWFLTFPICEQCNGKTSLFIRENKAPRPLTVRKESLIGGNPLRSLEERIASYRDTFYSCVESGQAERAMKAVAKARATFEAHTGDSGALIFRLPSGVDFHLDPKQHGLLLDPTVLSTEKPTFDPNLTRVPIRRKGPNPMRTRGKDFNDSDKSK